jgi:hypothetical protein
MEERWDIDFLRTLYPGFTTRLDELRFVANDKLRKTSFISSLIIGRLADALG